MTVMNLDFETYSEAGYSYDFATNRFKTANVDTGGNKKGIQLVGAYVYAQHPSAEILTASYSFDGGKTVHRWKPGVTLAPGRYEHWKVQNPNFPGVKLFKHVREGGLIIAWNSFFEWCVWNLIGVPKYGFPPLPIEQTRDTMAKAFAWSLPGGLAKASEALHGESEKDAEGKRIMLKFSQPRNVTANDSRLRYMRNDPENDKEHQDWERLDSYCDQDVRTEANIGAQLPDLSADELEVWKLDQKINARGILIDLPLVESCIKIMKEAKLRAGARLAVLTDGEVLAVSEATKILKSVNGVISRPSEYDSQGIPFLTRNLPIPYLKSLEIPIIIEHLNAYENHLHPTIKEILNIRLETGGNAPAKLIAMKYGAADDGRVRGVYQYCGAQRTRRWAGRGIQTQNMPNGGPEIKQCELCNALTGTLCNCNSKIARLHPVEWGIEAVEAVIPSLQTGNYDTVATLWKNPAKAVSGCLRSMLIAAPGYDYISSDYSAIEAVVMACMAGEQWIIDIFRGDGKLYERTGSKITGDSIETILQHHEDTGTHHPARKLGKVASLASQFQGARGAWRKFGAHKFLTDKEIDINVRKWREASPAIVAYWMTLEGAAMEEVRNRYGRTYVQRADRSETGVSFQMSGRALYCILPSGDWLTYVDPKIKQTKKLSRDGWKILELCEIIVEGPQMTIAGLTSKYRKRQEAEGELGVILAPYPQLFSSIRNANFYITGKLRKEITRLYYTWGDTLTYMGVGLNNSWCEIETYGGKLAENVTQATARFILSSAMLRIESAGYPIVMHTHDEIVSEIPEGTGSIEEFESIMSVMPEWASDWPIKAAGGWRGKRYRK